LVEASSEACAWPEQSTRPRSESAGSDPISTCCHAVRPQIKPEQHSPHNLTASSQDTTRKHKECFSLRDEPGL
jgi:hypothetical protein